MFLWDMDKLVEELKTERIARWKTRLFIFVSPIIHLSNLIILTTLVLGHQIIEYAFKEQLIKQDTRIDFYNRWAWTVVGATLFVWVLGVLFCYWINKKNDNKKFWQRLSILGFSVNFHITVYALIVLAGLGVLSYFGIMQKITSLIESIFPETDKIKNVTSHRDVISNMFRTTGSLIFLPLVPGKINVFLTNLRQVLLQLYPVISTLPPLLTMLHYVLVCRLLQKFGDKTTPLKSQNSCPIPPLSDNKPFQS